MLPTSVVVHDMPGRTRMRISAERNNEQFFAQAQETLMNCEGVSKVETNPLTGSILILHSSGIDEIKDFAERENLFAVQTANNSAPRPLFKRLSIALNSFDTRIAEMTEGQLNGKEALLSGLLVAAAFQIVQGNIWPAGGTLVWYALTFLPGPDRNGERAGD
jgi:Heavy metal associated domain 2